VLPLSVSRRFDETIEAFSSHHSSARISSCLVIVFYLSKTLDPFFWRTLPLKPEEGLVFPTPSWVPLPRFSAGWPLAVLYTFAWTVFLIVWPPPVQLLSSLTPSLFFCCQPSLHLSVALPTKGQLGILKDRCLLPLLDVHDSFFPADFIFCLEAALSFFPHCCVAIFGSIPLPEVYRESRPRPSNGFVFPSPPTSLSLRGVLGALAIS